MFEICKSSSPSFFNTKWQMWDIKKTTYIYIDFTVTPILRPIKRNPEVLSNVAQNSTKAIYWYRKHLKKVNEDFKVVKQKIFEGQQRERNAFSIKRFLGTSDHEKLGSVRWVSTRSIDCIQLVIWELIMNFSLIWPFTSRIVQPGTVLLWLWWALLSIFTNLEI